ncbi:MAG: dihydroorotate dehydrogenase electron transfer subunit [Christensenellales bacterium]
MKQSTYTILENRQIAKATCLMRLSGDTSAFTKPGQFLNITLPGHYLRRPFSICDWQKGEATIIYKVLGQGSGEMTAFASGVALDVLSGLGNGFNLDKSGDRPLLIGGGVGVPPLYRLAKELAARGKAVTVALGFGSGDEVFFKEEFEALGARVLVATMDGTAGIKGLVTDACDLKACTYFYACGPTAMLKAICKQAPGSGELSLEERMGCGFGACMGCTVFTTEGPQRVCKEGPVFTREVLGW